MKKISLIIFLAFLSGCSYLNEKQPAAPIGDAQIETSFMENAPNPELENDKWQIWLADKRGEIDEQTQAANNKFAKQEALCWQKFAVNDCISNARKIRRHEIALLREKTLLLNEKERNRRTNARIKRLKEYEQTHADKIGVDNE